MTVSSLNADTPRRTESFALLKQVVAYINVLNFTYCLTVVANLIKFQHLIYYSIIFLMFFASYNMIKQYFSIEETLRDNIKK
jgi:hypothetical protein